MRGSRVSRIVVPLGVVALAACSLDTIGESSPPVGGADSSTGPDRTLPPPPPADAGKDVVPDTGADAKDATRDIVPPADHVGTDAGSDHAVPEAGCMADTSTDSSNCGACGHDCMSGACIGGACQPVVLTTSSNPFALAVQGSTLYWTRGTQNTVDSCALPDCSKVTTAGGCTGTWGIAVDATHYYFSCNGQNQLYACANGSACGGSGPIMAAPWPTGLTLDSANIYYLSASNMMGDMHSGAVVMQALDGGPPKMLRVAQNFPSSIALGSGELFWSETSENAVASCSVSPTPTSCGASYMQIITGQASPDQVAVDAVHVYFTNNGTMPMYKDGSVVQANLDGTFLRTLASGRLYPRGLVVDAAYVYWVDYVSAAATTGTVNRVPIGGGTVVTLATGQAAPIGIAQDDKATYWGNSGDGTIVRLAK